MEATRQDTFTRNQLYELVWSQSLLSLSRKYAISDVGLRKLCIRMNIPLPKAGHWEKLKHGKPVDKIKLPTTYSGASEVRLSLRNEDDVDNISKKESVHALVKQLQANSELKFVVPDRLTSPDPLIASAKVSLSRKEASYGPYQGVISTSRGELTIRVSPQNISRALRILDTLIKALRSRGHTIEVDTEKTYVIINTLKIEVSIKEKLKRVIIDNPKWSWQSSELCPTGILSFRIEGGSEWKDGKEPLEAQLPRIIARLEMEAIRRKERQEQLEKFWQEQREKRRLAEEFAARKEKELIDFKIMLQKAERWHKAVTLRNYIEAVEQKAVQSVGPSEEITQWLAWARKKADWYDPFIEADDELLHDIDRVSLMHR
ncbi:hypothetical protein [Flavisolibacter tropicus]|uniref:Uncharacterized protein n=1 Tax=Flavisolibacter tropicus TaxID=1492898 RepID=A0A172TU58_9BACT|nr:hypothetical protein [Flavisolibacter tropicus]ANE50629.1 hypothetical protein SY85_09070 [Flavisolibacter tropicus]